MCEGTTGVVRESRAVQCTQSGVKKYGVAGSDK